MSYSIQKVVGQKDLEAVKKLLWDYGKSRGFDAAMGDFKHELAALPYRYASSEGGCLLIAKIEEQAVGCVAYQALESNICEMKRLYVEPRYRGLKIGKALVNTLCTMATQNGYELMRLDTFDYYQAAINSYKKTGFYEIPPYHKYDEKGILFFEKKLSS